MFVIPALEKLRQEDCHKLNTSLGNITAVRSNKAELQVLTRVSLSQTAEGRTVKQYVILLTERPMQAQRNSLLLVMCRASNDSEKNKDVVAPWGGREHSGVSMLLVPFY